MSTLEGDLAAQLPHGPCVCEPVQASDYWEQAPESGGYWYCPKHQQGSVTRMAPGKTLLRGEDQDELLAQYHNDLVDLESRAAPSKTVVRSEDFDALLAQESRPYRPNEALRAAAAHARTIVRHR